MTAGLPAQEPAESPAVESAPAGPQIVLPGIQTLTIGGQYRLRYENQYQYDFNDNAGASNDFFGQRLRLNVELGLNEQLTAFVQLQDVRNWGEEVSTIDDSADGLDLHQGWLRVSDVPEIGGTAKIGRQVVALGAQRLIGALDWLNQGRSFDGVFHTWDLDEGGDVLNVFFLDVRERINAVNDDAYLAGLYATFHPGEDGTLDGYFLWLHDDGTVVGMTENRGTLGMRYLGKHDGFEVEIEAATQFGEQAGQDIPIGETFAVHAHGSYDLADDHGAWVRLDFDAASGNDASSNDNARFNNLFPTPHGYWGMMDFAFWSNLVHYQAQVGFKAGARTKCLATWHAFRSMEETDRFFGPTATLSNGGAGFSREMGQEIDLLVDHDLGIANMRSSIQAGYGVFLPGNGVRDSLGTDDLAHFFYLMSNFAF